jgi:two-component system, NtrC family, response regulator HydG
VLQSPASQEITMGTRVLIVDDDADLAESLADLLLDYGCDVSIAGHGQEAVERACARDFDIIFMDVRMPVMNGADSFFAIRAIKPQARIVMMTGFKETFVERAIQAGAEGPLHKPFSVDDMLALIDDERARLQAEASGRWPARPTLMTHALSGTIH